MIDPLSIVASVVGITSAAVQSSRALFKLADDIKSRSDEIKFISRDARSLYGILFSLHVALQEGSIWDIVKGDEIMMSAICNLKVPLSDCASALRDLVSNLQKHRKFDADGSKYRINLVNVKWGLSNKAEVKGLQLRLAASKANLAIALDLVSMLCGFRLIAKRSLCAAPVVRVDTGSAVRRFIDDPTDVQPTLQGLFRSSCELAERNSSQDSLDIYSGLDDKSLTRSEASKSLVSLSQVLGKTCSQVQQERSVTEATESEDEEVSIAIASRSRANLGHRSGGWAESSTNEEFFDCSSRHSVNESSSISEVCHVARSGSRFSVDDWFSTRDTLRMPHSESPTRTFETSSSFFPEQYTIDGLFRDRIFVNAMLSSSEHSNTQKYFLTYAQTPRRWQRVIITATFMGNLVDSFVSQTFASDDHENNSKTIPEEIRRPVSLLLSGMKSFYNITSIALPLRAVTSGLSIIESARINAVEDSLEVNLCNEEQILQDIEDLRCRKISESEIVVQSRINSSRYKVKYKSLLCIERKVPFASAGARGKNGFESYVEELKLLKLAQGIPGIAYFVGVVLDDTMQHLRGYLYEYPSFLSVDNIFEHARAKSDTIPWHIREAWARQLIEAVHNIHEKGLVFGGSFQLGTIHIRANGTVVLNQFRLSSWHIRRDRAVEMAPELQLALQNDKNVLGRPPTFRMDIFHMALALWLLAKHIAMSSSACFKLGCKMSSYHECTADEENPVQLPRLEDIPTYLNDIIRQCRVSDPRNRPTARHLMKILSENEIETIDPAEVSTALRNYVAPRDHFINCDSCREITTSMHYHCNICMEADFDLCPSCVANGKHCWNPQHILRKTILKDGRYMDVT